MTDRISYRPAEAAAAIGVSRATLYRIIERRELPFLKIGNSTLITRADLIAYIEQRKGGPPCPEDLP